MVETKEILKSSTLAEGSAVFSRSDEYVETSGSCASHEVVIGAGAGGWPVGGIGFSIPCC